MSLFQTYCLRDEDEKKVHLPKGFALVGTDTFTQGEKIIIIGLCSGGCGGGGGGGVRAAGNNICLKVFYVAFVTQLL